MDAGLGRDVRAVWGLLSSYAEEKSLPEGKGRQGSLKALDAAARTLGQSGRVVNQETSSGVVDRVVRGQSCECGGRFRVSWADVGMLLFPSLLGLFWVGASFQPDYRTGVMSPTFVPLLVGVFLSGLFGVAFLRTYRLHQAHSFTSEEATWVASLVPVFDEGTLGVRLARRLGLLEFVMDSVVDLATLAGDERTVLALTGPGRDVLLASAAQSLLAVRRQWKSGVRSVSGFEVVLDALLESRGELLTVVSQRRSGVTVVAELEALLEELTSATRGVRDLDGEPQPAREVPLVE